MVSEKLLPCPFCGAGDKYLVQAFTQATETFAFWSVECSFCGVEVGDDESQEKANAAWNTRAPADLRSALEAETIERDQAFMAAVWKALKADANDLRKQQRILAAYRAALALTKEPAA
jgi:Lar family restriction alleviation protein